MTQKKRSMDRTFLILAVTMLLSLTFIVSTGTESVEGSTGERTEGKVLTRTSLEIDYIEDLQYIAIGEERFRDELKPLLDWKTQKGVRARFYPIDGENGILENYKDRDTQAEIRSFIIDAKEVNPSIKWVLLAGDGESIPARRTFANESAENGGDDESNYVNSDFYYAGLTGSWDQNGNEVYGEYMEHDWEADVYVGRLPASTRKEMSIMVRKQLSYEKDPPMGSWSESMLLSGSLMDKPNDPDIYQSYKDNAFELVLNVERDLPEDVTPFHLVDYPKMEYGGYNQMFDTLNRSSFEAFYEMGHSTVLVACHGDPFNGNCTNYKGEGGGRLPYIRDYEDHFTYEMAETIENGERLPLVYISSCGSTNFMETDDTNMERLLRNPNGGAVALIGATVDTYRGEFRPDPEDADENSSYGNWWLAQDFFRVLYGETARPGEALYKQKLNYNNHVERKYSYDPLYFRMFYIDNLAYNLLGDPEGPIWVRRPRTMDVVHPEPLIYDNGTLEVKVRDEAVPLENALVTITCMNDGETYITGRTNGLGIVEMDVERKDLRPLTLTVTMDGYVPFTKRIEVISDMNLAIDQVRLIPEIPVGREQFGASITISNKGSRDIEVFQVHLELEGGGEVESETILNITSGTSMVREFHLSSANRPDYGNNLLVASVEIVSLKDSLVIESDDQDNMVEMNFRANHPIEVADYIPPLKIKEDSTLALDNGPMNLTEPYVFDFDDFPRAASVWAEVIYGRLDLKIEGTAMDVIPEPDWFGQGRIRIFASDGSVTKNGTVDVKVIPQPDPPQFTDYPRTLQAKEDELTTFQVVVEDIDSDDVDLSSDKDWVSISRAPNMTSMVFNVSVMPTDENVGESLITLIAMDDTNRSEEIRINIDVDSTNDPPVISLMGNLTLEQGSRKEIYVSIEDPDGDTEFFINASWRFGSFQTRHPNFTLEVPDDCEPGTYDITIEVNDHYGGTSRITEHVTIVEKETSTSFIFIVLVIMIIVAILLAYGIFIRLQENKQKRVLDSVGTNATLEAKELSEKDFNKRRRRDGGLPMPPAPSNIEGALVREVKKEERAPPSTKKGMKDLDTEIEDVLSELFPREGRK
ncbi:MAG: C25 family cysteine peptidase [Thermoplasmatota archaeon]